MNLKLLSFFSLFLAVQYGFSQSSVRLGVSYKANDSQADFIEHIGVDIPAYFKFRSANKYMAAGLSELSLETEDVAGLGKSLEWNVSPYAEFGRIIGSAESKIRYRFGTRFIFGNSFERFDRRLSSDFVYSSFSTGVSFAVVPAVQYKLGERCWLDIDFPFRLITISSTLRKTINPQLPEPYKTNSGLEGELLPKIYQLQMGLIYMFGN